ncbi:hypothetical protein Tco_1136411, partial [Tanacetum coccineum]
VVFKERKNDSLVLFVKGVEKSMMLNTEAHASSKSKIESLPGNVVVIASHSYGQSQGKSKNEYYGYKSTGHHNAGAGVMPTWHCVGLRYDTARVSVPMALASTGILVCWCYGVKADVAVLWNPKDLDSSSSKELYSVQGITLTNWLHLWDPYSSTKGNVSLICLNFDEGKDGTRIRTVVTGKEVIDANVKKPFKKTAKTPLTQRIIEFAGPEFKIPANVKLYDETTDPEDHVSWFSSAKKSGEWPMPVWCRMFQQTLDESARGWFKHLPIGSIDGLALLRQ